jgi:hypothetical protein
MSIVHPTVLYWVFYQCCGSGIDRIIRNYVYFVRMQCPLLKSKLFKTFLFMNIYNIIFYLDIFPEKVCDV